MKKMMILSLLLCIPLLFSLPGCGSGGGSGSSVPTKAVIKLSTQVTSGTVAAKSISGVQLTLVLPAGVTVKANNTGKTDGGVVVATGNAAAATVYSGTYTPATSSTNGTIVVLIGSTTGFDPGEFANVTCDLASGASPKSTDFSIQPGAEVFDIANQDVIANLGITYTVELK